MTPTLKQISRGLGAAVAVGVAVLLLLEAGLATLAAFTSGRGGHWRPGAQVRILCLGDSHTFGAGVEPTESYPAQLQALLDEHDAGRFSVLNLGIPGMNSAQLASRLPANLARYRPDMVIVWVGTNDVWNSAEFDLAEAGLGSRLDAWALRSRVYRALRVWRHDRTLQSAREELRNDGRPQPGEFRIGERTTRLPMGDVEETLHPVYEEAGEAEVVAHTTRAFTDMARFARSAGRPLVLMRYPLSVRTFQAANRVARQVADQYGLSFVDTEASMRRIPKEELEWRWTAHPSPRLYGEIAADLLPVVLVLAEEGG